MVAQLDALKSFVVHQLSEKSASNETIKSVSNEMTEKASTINGADEKAADTENEPVRAAPPALEENTVMSVSFDELR